MNDRVSFDVDRGFESRAIMGHKKDPALVTFLIKNNIAATADSANRMLLAVVVTCIVVTCAIVGYYILGIGNTPQVRYNIPPQLQGQLLLDQQSR